VDETLVIAPLTATEDINPVLRNQHTLKTTAQAEVLAGHKELREHLIINPNDGKSSDTDEGLVTYSRSHGNDCPAVHTLTNAAREAILSEAARTAQEAKAIENKQPEDDETKRKADEKQVLDAAVAAANETQAAENKQREDAETKRKAAETLELNTANESPVAARKRKAARAAAEKKYTKATAVAKKAQTILAKAQVTCTKTSKDVVLAHQQIKAAERAQKKAEEVHKTSVWQLADLEKALADANSKLTAAV
jgi:hypothetical protein